MLMQEFTETVEVDGQQVEVWLKAPRTRRPVPKVARHLGSAFLVAGPDAAFVVTAAHVAHRMERDARLFCAGPSGKRRVLRLRDLVSAGRRRIPWTFHPRADVAAARIPEPPPVLRRHFLPLALLDRERAAPSGSLELVAIGFPLGLTSYEHFGPISKRVHAASGLVRFTGEEMSGPALFFLLDQPSMGGSSGGPVFVAPQVQTSLGGDVAMVVEARCVGLVSQTISDEAGGQFAAVVPSVTILDTVARAAQRRA